MAHQNDVGTQWEAKLYPADAENPRLVGTLLPFRQHAHRVRTAVARCRPICTRTHGRGPGRRVFTPPSVLKSSIIPASEAKASGSRRSFCMTEAGHICRRLGEVASAKRAGIAESMGEAMDAIGGNSPITGFSQGSRTPRRLDGCAGPHGVTYSSMARTRFTSTSSWNGSVMIAIPGAGSRGSPRLRHRRRSSRTERAAGGVRLAGSAPT